MSVREDPGQCPICGGQWNVQKSIFRRGKTIGHGQFEVCETVHVCATRCSYNSGRLVTRRATSLSEYIIPGRGVGYDVMVFIGLKRFLHHHQREEIRTELSREHGIFLSCGEISNLGKLFLSYLQKLHLKHMDQFRDILASDGGWPLHIDATGEDGRGTLLVAFAGWRRWVLGAWKVPTERADTVLPRLREVVRHFGTPCAIMRDLGRAMTSAANNLLIELELDIPILACHQHFLKDIGNDLLKPSYGELRRLFRNTNVQSKLRSLARELGRELGCEIGQAREEVKTWLEQTGSELDIPQGRAGIAAMRSFTQWIIDYHAESTGYDFPFDRPYLDFYNRCVFAYSAIGNFLRKNQQNRKILKVLKRLEKILYPVTTDLPFRQIVRRLKARATLFDELRDTLRLTPKNSTKRNENKAKNIFSSVQSVKELQNIRRELNKLTTSLKDRRPKRGPAQDIRSAIDLILRHITDHGNYLWGHEITLPVTMGGGIRLVERTNNILEGFFGEMKHNERRRSGRKILTQDFEHLPPEAALVYNLKHNDYVSTVCGSLEKLPETFASLDFENRQGSYDRRNQAIDSVVAKTPLTETASLPTADRRLIRMEEMQQKIMIAGKNRVRNILRQSI